jgi:hypothetical protein
MILEQNNAGRYLMTETNHELGHDIKRFEAHLTDTDFARFSRLVYEQCGIKLLPHEACSKLDYAKGYVPIISILLRPMLISFLPVEERMTNYFI